MKSPPPIVSLNDLASRLGYRREDLQRLVDEIDTDRRLHYRWTPLWESGSIVRQLRVPRPFLKEVQGRIKRNIFDRLAVSESAHGSVKGRSSKTNANPHLGQPFVAKVDVRRFFPSVKHDAVFQLMRDGLGYGRDVCRMLTRLTTVDDQLPQGSPTSPSIANLLLTRTVDEPLREAAQHVQSNYTRYVDDITLSGRQPHTLIQTAAKLLSRQQLRIHRSEKKLRVMSRAEAQSVTGVVVNHAKKLSKEKAYRDNIRAAIFVLGKLDGPDRVVAERRIAGQIAYVQSIQPASAAKLAGLLDKAMHLAPDYPRRQERRVVALADFAGRGAGRDQDGQSGKKQSGQRTCPQAGRQPSELNPGSWPRDLHAMEAVVETYTLCAPGGALSRS